MYCERMRLKEALEPRLFRALIPRLPSLSSVIAFVTEEKEFDLAFNTVCARFVFNNFLRPQPSFSTLHY